MENWKIIIIVTAVLGLFVIFYENFTLNYITDNFEVVSLFYKVDENENESSRELYNKIYAIEEDCLCKIEFNRVDESESRKFSEESIYYIPKKIERGEELNLAECSSDCRGFFKEDEVLISPINNIEFINNHIIPSSLFPYEHKDNIEFIIGYDDKYKYIMVLKDIKSWFCQNHVEKPKDSKHISNNEDWGSGKFSNLLDKTIIGRASDKTTMFIVKRSVNSTGVFKENEDIILNAVKYCESNGMVEEELE